MTGHSRKSPFLRRTWINAIKHWYLVRIGSCWVSCTTTYGRVQKCRLPSLGIVIAGPKHSLEGPTRFELLKALRHISSFAHLLTKPRERQPSRARPPGECPCSVSSLPTLYSSHGSAANVRRKRLVAAFMGCSFPAPKASAVPGRRSLGRSRPAQRSLLLL
jgi:hypothetical protein